MKIKSLMAASIIAASGLYSGASMAQTSSLPVIGLLSGGLGDGGIPLLGSLGLGGDIPVLGSFDFGAGIPLFGNFDGVLPSLPGLDELVDVSAVPLLLPELLTDLPRSLGRNAGSVSGVIGLVTQLNPLQSGGTVIGIGSNLGVGALYSLVPVVDVLTNDPANIVEYLLGNGTILTEFGILGTLPGIPVVTAPLGLGFAEGIPILGGLPDGAFAF